MTTRKLRKKIRRIILELCDPMDTSSGWIPPSGEYIDLESKGIDHFKFAADILEKKPPEYSDLVEQFEEFKLKDFGAKEVDRRGEERVFEDFLQRSGNWVRVVNAFVFSGPNISKVTSRQISTMIDLVKQCDEGKNEFYVYEFINVEDFETRGFQSFIAWLKNRGRIRKSKLAQFH